MNHRFQIKTKLALLIQTSFSQVDLDEEATQSITDSAGFITKEDFMKFAKERKLVDFDERKDDTPKKEWAPVEANSKVNK